MKILYITTIGGTMKFFNSFIKEMLDEGHTVDIATNYSDSAIPSCYKEWGCKAYQIDTSRSPLNMGNYNAIKQLKAIVERGEYDIVHCHTPIAAVCTRLACLKARKKGTKVIYTAHGFHFYQGAPVKNWLLFYPAEKFCARYTDVLITINQEDFAFAKKKLQAKRIVYVPGVGIDLNKFSDVKVDRALKRRELGIPEDATLLISVGELNKNKNHETVIRAISGMDIYYVIAGKGGLQEHLQNVIDTLGMTDRVKLLGFRRDVSELYKAADIYVLPSFREGLNVSIMEAMTSGLPCVVSKIRGNVDQIEDGVGGFLCNSDDIDGFARAIAEIANNDKQRMQIRANNLETSKGYNISIINQKIRSIYQEAYEETNEKE